MAPTSQPAVEPQVPHDPADTRRSPKRSLLDPSIVGPALVDSGTKLDPRAMARNPVMFVVEVGSAFGR